MTGSEFKTARKKLDLTQSEMGEALEMSREAIGLMERGINPVKKRTELAMKHLLRCKMVERIKSLNADLDGLMD